MTTAPATQGSSTDPRALIRTRAYRSLLALAAVIGLVVSTVCWLFLEAVHEIEVAVYEDVPKHLGYAEAPIWWSGLGILACTSGADYCVRCLRA